MKFEWKSKMKSGFAILGVVVALAVLGALSFGLTILVAENASNKASEHNTNQDFYVSHASFEHAMRRIKVDGVTTVPTLDFLNTPIGVTRSGGRVGSSTTFGSGRYVAANSYSMVDPNSGGTGPMYMYVMGSGSGTLSITGAGQIYSPSSSIYVDSSSGSAISIVGSGSINAYSVNIMHGSYSIVGTGSITTHSGTVNTNQSCMQDPLASYNMPSYASCTYTNTTILTNTTLNPGVYCGGISIVGSPTVTLNPGNYILDGGSFSSTGGAIISGNGVTIFLNKQIQSSYATFNLTMTGGSVTLTAPTTGTYAGIAIFQSRNAPSSGTNNIVGNTNLQITGAIYLPNQTLNYVGGSSANPPCTMFVVDKLSITGSANVRCTSGALSGLVH